MGKKLANFELQKEYVVFCPGGPASISELAEQMSRAVRYCRDHKIDKLLIDTTSLPELPPPGLAERYNLVERIAADAESSVKIAHVASLDWVRTGKFALLVAKNRGLDAQHFTSRSAAVEWLLAAEANTAESKNGEKPGPR